MKWCILYVLEFLNIELQTRFVLLQHLKLHNGSMAHVEKGPGHCLGSLDCFYAPERWRREGGSGPGRLCPLQEWIFMWIACETFAFFYYRYIHPWASLLFSRVISIYSRHSIAILGWLIFTIAFKGCLDHSFFIPYYKRWMKINWLKRCALLL